MLSLLLLNDCRTVSTVVLMREIWEDGPPKSGPTTLQTYVLHLRRLFSRAFDVPTAEIARDLLQTRSGGYAFMIESGHLDVHRFVRWRDLGDQALARQEDQVAVDAYQHALDEWYGPALTDVEYGPLMRAEVARLEQSRLTVTERKITIELRLGRHLDTLSELASLVVRHRFHEDLHAQFMLALHRSGNRSRALEVFNLLRSSMIAELGLEPSPKVQRLHHAILAAKPELDLLESDRRRAADEIYAF
ncbi:MAG TPA: AfsR/SARP family transcriptional regulator [Pseudonocardiaceae bacterium]